MDLKDIEKAATIVYAICREHPEICPHDYEASRSIKYPDGKFEQHYICNICGNEKVEVY